MIGRLARLAGLVAAAGPVLALQPGAAQATPGPPSAPEWWFDSWQVPSLWAAGGDGRGITVAVVDTGVQASLPELQGKILAGADFIGNGSDGRVDYDSDDFSHGTAMASIIVARQGYGDIEGLAPAAKILPLSVPLRGVIRKGTPTENATSAAINYAADHGARIISMSLGGVREQSDGPDPCPASVQKAVLHALSKGALVVAASGNSGDQGSPVEEPGVCLGVVSVGSVDRQLNVSPFSSRHPYLTVTAPGDRIPSLSRDSAYIGEGTSQATALASAALAMIWSRYPDRNEPAGADQAAQLGHRPRSAWARFSLRIGGDQPGSSDRHASGGGRCECGVRRRGATAGPERQRDQATGVGAAGRPPGRPARSVPDRLSASGADCRFLLCG